MPLAMNLDAHNASLLYYAFHLQPSWCNNMAVQNMNIGFISSYASCCSSLSVCLTRSRTHTAYMLKYNSRDKLHLPLDMVANAVPVCLTIGILTTIALYLGLHEHLLYLCDR